METFRFNLLHNPSMATAATYFDDPLYDAIRADPPQGCTPRNFEPYFGLECVREGDSKWHAITTLIFEIQHRYGLLFNDLGIEKLDEWYDNEPDGAGPELVVQLLSMASERGAAVGVAPWEMVGFLHLIRPQQ